MDAFRHVLSLLAFVYALALTQLLSRVGLLFVASERVKFSGLSCLTIVIAIVLVYVNWLSLWDLRGYAAWNLPSITAQFLFAISLYLVCALAGPHPAAEAPIDMRESYWRRRKPFYWALVACSTLGLAGNVQFLQTAKPSLFLEESTINLAAYVPCALALAVPKAWAQWLAGVAVLLLLIAFTLIFEGRIG